MPGCEKKARDLTLVDKRYSTAGCSRCVGWTGLPSGLPTYTLVRWSTLLWAPLGRAGSQVRFVHQRWRPKERGSPGQVAPDFQPLASRAVTLPRGEGGWSFGDRYLAADSCAQTWILRDPGFFIFCTSRLGVAAPKQKTVKDITSRLPFSQSPSSWSCSSHKAKAGSSALVSIVLIPLPEPGNQWSSARQTRRRYGSSAKFSVPDLGPGTPGLGGGCTDRGLAGLLSFPVGASPSSIASRNLPPPRRYSLDKNNIPVQVHTPDLQGKPRRQRRRPIPPSPRTSTTTPNESRVKQNHEKPTNRPGSLPPSRTDDTSPTRAPPFSAGRE